MKTAAQLKSNRARLIGSLYFVLLSTGGLATSVVSGFFEWLYVALMVITFLPLLLRNRFFLMGYAFLQLLLWSYIGLAIMLEGMQGFWSYVAISGITICALISALLMIYGAISRSDREFSLI